MVRLLPCLALALLVSLPGSHASAQASRPKAGQTQQDLAKVKERIRGLEKESRKDEARRKDLEKQLRVTETDAARLRKELNATRRQLEEARQRLAELTRQTDETRSNLKRQQSALAGQLRLAHMTGGTERVQAIFNQQDPAGIDRRLTWLAYVARTRSELLGSIHASLAALERDLQLQAEQEETLAQLETRRSEQLAEIENSRKERAKVVATLDAQLKGQKQQLAQARNQAAALEKLLKELERAAARAKREAAPAARTPQLPAEGKPLGKGHWPVDGKLLADFGQPRAGGQLRWDGVLIAASAGTEVRSVRPGKVVYADWLPGLGLLLVLDHGGGYLSLYGHNQDLARDVGDRVAAGEVLGHVGDTGGQSRPALYFEVRRNGRPVNPRQWVN